MLKILAKQERQQLFAGKNAFQDGRQWEKKTPQKAIFNTYPDKCIICI